MNDQHVLQLFLCNSPNEMLNTKLFIYALQPDSDEDDEPVTKKPKAAQVSVLPMLIISVLPY